MDSKRSPSYKLKLEDTTERIYRKGEFKHLLLLCAIITILFSTSVIAVPQENQVESSTGSEGEATATKTDLQESLISNQTEETPPVVVTSTASAKPVSGTQLNQSISNEQELTGKSPQTPRSFLLNYNRNPSTSNPLILSSVTRQTRQTTKKKVNLSTDSTTSTITTSKPSTTTEELDETVTEAVVKEREKKKKTITQLRKPVPSKKKPLVEPTTLSSIDEFEETIDHEEEEDIRASKRRRQKTTLRPEPIETNRTLLGSNIIEPTSTKTINTTQVKNDTVDTVGLNLNTPLSTSISTQNTNLLSVPTIVNGGVPVPYQHNCCCNQTFFINGTNNVEKPEMSQHNSTLLTNKTIEQQPGPIAGPTTIASVTTPNPPMAHNVSIVNPDKVPKQMHTNTTGSDALHRDGNANANVTQESLTGQRGIAEMMKDMNEDHSKLHANVQDQASSLRRFIIMSSICVVIATSIAVALIVFFLK